MARNNGIPTADEEALQQPTIDPIALLAAIGTGGLTGYNMGPAALKKDLPGLLEYIANKGMTPQSYMGRSLFLKEAGKSALEAGGNFLSGDLVNNAITRGKHPLFSNYASLPMLSGEILDILPEEATIDQEGGAFAKLYPNVAKLLRGTGSIAMTPSLVKAGSRDK